MNRPPPHIPDSVAASVFSQVSAERRIGIADMLSETRRRPVAYARQHVMWLLRRRGYSWSEIGRVTKRDHSTAIFGVRAHAKRIATPHPQNEEARHG